MGRLDMAFELIIRNAFDCNQYGVECANANLYSHLNSWHGCYKDMKNNPEGFVVSPCFDLDEVEYEYTQACNSISNCLIKATKKVIYDKPRLSVEDKKILLDTIQLLEDFPDFEPIEKSISDIIRIMRKAGYKNWSAVGHLNLDDNV